MFLEAESDADSCTHVVARHAEQPSVGWAAARGQHAVTHFWVWECCRAQQLLPLGDPVRFGPALQHLLCMHQPALKLRAQQRCLFRRQPATT